jgi:hypothetical protein
LALAAPVRLSPPLGEMWTAKRLESGNCCYFFVSMWFCFRYKLSFAYITPNIKFVSVQLIIA